MTRQREALVIDDERFEDPLVPVAVQRAGAARWVRAGVAEDTLAFSERSVRLRRLLKQMSFAGSDGKPFHAASLYRRADRAWSAEGLSERLRLHQARHTYASFMIAVGVNAKAISVFMGHSSINVTCDLYGHLMPGAESEAAALLDTFLDGS